MRDRFLLCLDAFSLLSGWRSKRFKHLDIKVYRKEMLVVKIQPAVDIWSLCISLSMLLHFRRGCFMTISVKTIFNAVMKSGI